MCKKKKNQNNITLTLREKVRAIFEPDTDSRMKHDESQTIYYIPCWTASIRKTNDFVIVCSKGNGLKTIVRRRRLDHILVCTFPRYGF